MRIEADTDQKTKKNPLKEIKKITRALRGEL